MEQYFASLSKRQTMLLLTAVTFGGPEGIEALDGLPPDEAELLKHRAEEILRVPKDKRIPLLVQEIKRLFTQGRKQLTGADPLQLAAILKKERPAMVEVVLRALPAYMAEALQKKLSHKPVKLAREISPEVLNIIRWKLESSLADRLPKQGFFEFTDVLWVASRELATVCDRMGARVLAMALAGLNAADRETFVAALPPDQKALAVKAAVAGEPRKLAENDARALMALHGAFENPTGAMRSAGAQRVVRACFAESPDFAAQLLERHPGEMGQVFARWIREERQRPIRGDGGRADIVEQLEKLAQRGLIDRPVRLAPPPSSSADGMPGGRLLPPPARKKPPSDKR